jgi:hypothetical protein
MDVSSDELKIIVGKLLDEDSSKKFTSIVDICLFLWEIVDKIMEGVNDKNMTLQQKEDLAVLIANSVVNFLEERGMITVELAEKSRRIISTADVFLDLLLGLKGVGSLKQMVSNPTKENCFKGIFAIFSCFSAKNARVPTPVTGKPKIEFIDVIPQTEAQEAQPEPVVEAQPEPVVEAQPEPVVEAQPEPVVEAQPEPESEEIYTEEEKIILDMKELID